MHLRRPPFVSALAAALILGACSVDGGLLDEAATFSTVFPHLAVVESPSNDDAMPINRIALVSARVEDGAVLDEAVVDVDPTDDEWVLEVTIPGAEGVTVYVYVTLIHVTPEGDELVQFSGRTDPITITSGESALPDVPIVRGPIENLFATGVTIESAPASLVEGEDARLLGVVTTSQSTPPTIFWTSLDEGVLTMDGPDASALSPGLARIVASAGAFADTTTIAVLSSDSIGPFVTSISPPAGATAVAPLAPITVTFDEALDPVSVSTSTVTLLDSLGALVPATVSYGGLVVTLAPDLPLDTAHTYRASVTTGIRDVVGNPLATEVSWLFTTARAATLVSSFDAGLGVLVSIAFDLRAGTLFLQPDFDPLTVEYSTAGSEIGTGIPQPGASSNDIDLDFADLATGFGQTPVPANTLLVLNGENAPGTLYAVQKDDGVVLDSLPIPATGNPVGGAYHTERGTFFSVAWNTDLITEIDLATGTAVASFPVSPVGSVTYDVFYGDLEVDPASGMLLLVSSNETSIRVLDPTGAFVRDIDVGAAGVTGMSGIAWDAETRTAWITSTTGLVYQVGGLGL